MKHSILILFFLLHISSNIFAQDEPLQIEKDSRYITYSNGKPFFWLGDTAWELFHRLTLEEAKLYLKDRSNKGFNVIQAVVLAEQNGLNTPNRNGDKPLINNDPGKPNEKYFKHVDQVIKEANKLGMFVGLLPTWGDKFNKKWGVGPEIFNAENAYSYAQFLAKRYKNEKIIWILGGDRNPESASHLAIVNAMASGIRNIISKKQLITYHPQGGSTSSESFHDAPWLDFNMLQSGHDKKNGPNYEMIGKDYHLSPIKPTLDGEPRYENHPINWKPQDGFFNDFDIRQAAWWALLSGACGHTYGAHDIWQMFDISRNPAISSARTYWKTALNLPGSSQVGYMKHFFTEIPWQTLIPNQDMLQNNVTKDASYQMAAFSKSKDIAVVYSPYGKNIKIDLSLFTSNKLVISWFNPRDATYIKIGEFGNTSVQEFTPYVQGPETDWVLLIKPL